jgi:hypothetical protein
VKTLSKYEIVFNNKLMIFWAFGPWYYIRLVISGVKAW